MLIEEKVVETPYAAVLSEWAITVVSRNITKHEEGLAKRIDKLRIRKPVDCAIGKLDLIVDCFPNVVTHFGVVTHSREELAIHIRCTFL